MVKRLPGNLPSNRPFCGQDPRPPAGGAQLATDSAPDLSQLALANARAAVSVLRREMLNCRGTSSSRIRAARALIDIAIPFSLRDQQQAELAAWMQVDPQKAALQRVNSRDIRSLEEFILKRDSHAALSDAEIEAARKFGADVEEIRARRQRHLEAAGLMDTAGLFYKSEKQKAKAEQEQNDQEEAALQELEALDFPENSDVNLSPEEPSSDAEAEADRGFDAAGPLDSSEEQQAQRIEPEQSDSEKAELQTAEEPVSAAPNDVDPGVNTVPMKPECAGKATVKRTDRRPDWRDSGWASYGADRRKDK
jgi:hypothetical protein